MVSLESCLEGGRVQSGAAGRRGREPCTAPLRTLSCRIPRVPSRPGGAAADKTPGTKARGPGLGTTLRAPARGSARRGWELERANPTQAETRASGRSHSGTLQHPAMSCRLPGWCKQGWCGAVKPAHFLLPAGLHSAGVLPDKVRLILSSLFPI